MSMSVIALVILAMAIAAVAYRARRPKTMQRREALSSVRAEAEESDYWRGMYRREEEAFAAYSRKAAALRQDASITDTRIHAVDKDIQSTLRYWSTCLIFEDVDEFAPTRAELDRLFDRRARILAGE